MRVVLCCAGLMLAASQAWPADLLGEDASDDILLVGEAMKVISIAELPQSIHSAPAAATVIDRRMIDASGARTIADLLNSVPGFLVVPARSSLDAVTARGLADHRSRRLLVLVDGHSTYTPFLHGGVEWGQLNIDIDDIERIEVVHGSNAATNGSYALMGVVNIITRSATASADTTFRLDRDERLGSHATVGGTVRDQRYALAVRASVTDDNGVQGNKHRLNKIATRTRLDWSLTEADSLTVAIDASNLQTDTGFRFSHNNPIHPYELDRIGASFRWAHILSTGNEWHLRGSFTRREGREHVPATDPRLPGVTANVNYDYTGVGSAIELQRINATDTKFRYNWALGLSQHSYEMDDAVLDPRGERVRVGYVRGHAEWSLAQRWTAHLGALVEKSSDATIRMSPRMALVWEPNSTDAWRATVSSAWRSPSVFERFPDETVRVDGASIPPMFGGPYPGKPVAVKRYIPNPSLHAEHLRSAEFGWHRQRPDGGYIQARAYLERIDDTILRSKSPYTAQLIGNSTTQYVNGPAFTIRGLEVSARETLANGGWIGAWWVAQNATSHNRLLEQSTPHINIGVNAMTPVGKWQLGLSIQHHGAVRWLDGSGELDGDTASTVQLSRAIRLQPTGGRLRLAIGMRQLLEPRRAYESRDEIGRALYVSVAGEF